MYKALTTIFMLMLSTMISSKIVGIPINEEIVVEAEQEEVFREKKKALALENLDRIRLELKTHKFDEKKEREGIERSMKEIEESEKDLKKTKEFLADFDSKIKEMSSKWATTTPCSNTQSTNAIISKDSSIKSMEQKMIPGALSSSKGCQSNNPIWDVEANLSEKKLSTLLQIDKKIKLSEKLTEEDEALLKSIEQNRDILTRGSLRGIAICKELLQKLNTSETKAKELLI